MNMIPALTDWAEPVVLHSAVSGVVLDRVDCATPMVVSVFDDVLIIECRDWED